MLVITAQDDDRVVVAALDARRRRLRGQAVRGRAGGGTDPRGPAARRRRRARPSRTSSPTSSSTHALARRRMHGEPLELSRKEFELLLALISRAGEVVTRRELLDRGLAAAVRRRRPHRRRPPLVAAAQARRDGCPAALPAHRPRRRGPSRRPADRNADDATPISWLVAATTSAVVLAFLVPLAPAGAQLGGGPRPRVRQRRGAVGGDPGLRLPTPDAVAELVASADRRSPAQTSVLLPDGTVLGAADERMATDPGSGRARPAARSPSRTTADTSSFIPVVDADGTSVVRTTVGADLERAGVCRAWAGLAPARVRPARRSPWWSPTGWVAGSASRSPTSPRWRSACTTETSTRAPVPQGPEETVELGRDPQPPRRPDRRAARGRARGGRRPLAPAAHAGHGACGSMPTRVRGRRARRSAAAAHRAPPAHRRRHRPGRPPTRCAPGSRLVRRQLGDRASGRRSGPRWPRTRPARCEVAAARPSGAGRPRRRRPDRHARRARRQRVRAHPRRTAFAVRLARGHGRRGRSRSPTAGRGLGAGRPIGDRRPGTTGLGLQIVRRTAAGAGGHLELRQDDGLRRPRDAPGRTTSASCRRLRPSPVSRRRRRRRRRRRGRRRRRRHRRRRRRSSSSVVVAVVVIRPGGRPGHRTGPHPGRRTVGPSAGS